MKFTNLEMIFLNSISGGGMLFGLSLHEGRGMEESMVMEKVMQGLREKGILETERGAGQRERQTISQNSRIQVEEKLRLSRQGGYYAYLLKQYRNAQKHIIYNYLHAGIVTQDKAVVILPTGKEYEICLIPTAALAGILLQSCPLERVEGEIKQGQEQEDYEKKAKEVCLQPKVERMRRMRVDQMLREIQKAEDVISFGSFRDSIVEMERVYYRLDKFLYIYDILKQRRIQVRAEDIRKEVTGVILPWRRVKTDGR